MDKRYRVHFINSLSGFKSANLVGTQDMAGATNLSIVNSVFHLGADPALMGMIIRPRSVPRHSFDNLRDTGFYTLNHVNSQIYQQAHQTSARYEKDQSEFAATGLTCEYLNGFPAPFVKESNVKIGLRFVESQTLAVNDTELVIGEIVCVNVDEQSIHHDGFIDLVQLDSVAVNGLDGYCSGQLLDRLSYAKPNLKLSSLLTK